MEMTERKKRILRAIVESYIATAEPVGSKAVAQLAGLDVSSATIRNEMAELTTLGYLEQPHTSAGPTPITFNPIPLYDCNTLSNSSLRKSPLSTNIQFRRLPIAL